MHEKSVQNQAKFVAQVLNIELMVERTRYLKENSEGVSER